MLLRPVASPIAEVRLREGAEHKEQSAEEEEGADPEGDALDGRREGLLDAVAVKEGEAMQLGLVLDVLPLRPIAPMLPRLPRVAPAHLI